MGSYCDSCFTLFGSCFDGHGLQYVAGYDLCESCTDECKKINDKFIEKHKKFNKIGCNV